MTSEEAYRLLCQRSVEIAYVGSAMAISHWDQRICIPPKGHQHRVGLNATLARIRHERLTDPRVGELLECVEDSELCADPLSVPSVNIREWRRTYDRMTKIPEELAVAIAKAASEGEAVWEESRPRNDWERFRPCLELLVTLRREQADAIGYEDEPYDALLDDYERGATTRSLAPLFERLGKGLKDLLERIEGSRRGPDPSMTGLRFPADDQAAFAGQVAEHLGYDSQAGRLDVSAHPFTTGIGPGDVRITTRFDETDFSEGLFAVIHEAGHAMYHQGLPVEHWGEPFCRPISLGINESQSRMWENMVARSLNFWKYFYPKAQKRFPGLRDVDLPAYLRSINEVSPGLIRVAADEVTYNLHVLLRFELETALMRDDLRTADLPDAWNEKMRHLLGLVPPDHASGVMQDVHWSSGSIGYFPTYTLGNLYAAQLLSSARRDIGQLELLFERGEFGPLREWLRAKIHSQGSRYVPADLIKLVTGEDLNPQYFLDYLEERYSVLYELS